MSDKGGALERLVSQRNGVGWRGGELLVGTDVLLPSGLQVLVTVHPRPLSQFVVSDGGEALKSLSDAGSVPDDALYAEAQKFAYRSGLVLHAGVLSSQPITEDDVVLAVVQVANAARDLVLFVSEEITRRADPGPAR